MFNNLIIQFKVSYIGGGGGGSYSIEIVPTYILFFKKIVYIPFVCINHTMIMVSDKSATRKLSRFLECNCCWIYGTDNYSDATIVEYMALSYPLVNYNYYFLLRKFITGFFWYNML